MVREIFFFLNKWIKKVSYLCLALIFCLPTVLSILSNLHSAVTIILQLQVEEL